MTMLIKNQGMWRHKHKRVDNRATALERSVTKMPLGALKQVLGSTKSHIYPIVIPIKWDSVNKEIPAMIYSLNQQGSINMQYK